MTDSPVKWERVAPGVRFRPHPTRKHGLKPDRYFVLRYRAGGQHHQEALGWASEGWTVKRAQEELVKLKAAIRTGDGPVSLAERRQEAEAKRQAEADRLALLAREEMAFADFWRESYFPQAQRDKTPRSWKREDQFFRLWLAPVIGRLALKSVSPLHLERVKKSMADAGRAPRSISYCLAVVRQVFNQARLLGLYQGEAPTSKVKPPRADNRRLRFLSQEEAASLLEALTLSSRNLHDIALLSLHTGMRAGEVFNLTWGDVDLDNGLLALRDTKSGRTRHAYMTAAVKEMLRDLPKGKLDELVFPARSGERRVQVSQVFRRVVETLRLNEGLADPRQQVTFHTLRHTFASWLVMNGTPLYTVQKLLGHQSISMTERYSHLAPDHMRDAVNGFEKSIRQAQDADSATMADGRS